MNPVPRFQPRRELGRTGFLATRLGIGDLADRALPIEQCISTAKRAIDAGLNLIDTAPGYEDGYSEQIVGQAVKGNRDRLFVISKIDHPDQPVSPQIDASLKRMELYYTDLFVFHGLSSLDLWRKVSTPGGAMDELTGCIRSGKSRFRGKSSHHPDVLRQAILSGLCDVVMFPIGAYVDTRYVVEILPLAKRHGVGSVCFKTFGAGKLLGDTSGYNQPLQQRPRGKLSSGGVESSEAVLPRMTVRDCLHFTMSVDPDVALLGLSFPNEQDAAWEAFDEFAQPLSLDNLADLRRRASAAIQGKGPCWWNPSS